MRYIISHCLFSHHQTNKIPLKVKTTSVHRSACILPAWPTAWLSPLAFQVTSTGHRADSQRINVMISDMWLNSLFVCCCDKAPLPKAAWERKTVLWGHGDRGIRGHYAGATWQQTADICSSGNLSIRLFSCEHKQRMSWTESETMNSQSPTPVLHFLPQGHITSPKSTANWWPSVQVPESMGAIHI